ncbi:MAG: hypothetical protein KKG00_09330 [Bacteroidetes bacterium]|nr:hypothetical protein [Bacteroidota bacterium]
MLSFDSAPVVYWAVGYTLAVVVIGLNLKKNVSLPLYLTAATGLVVLMRLPAILLNRELNADESQMLSHALTLWQDPVYWRSVDGTTIGPLDNYLLVLPRLLGFQLDYTSARIMGLLCVVGSLLFFFRALYRWFGRTLAQVGLLIPLLFLAFTQETDFVHYSSEQLPVFLLSICLALLADLTTESRLSPRRTFWLGLVAGMVPFAKLQAVPQAGLLVIGALYLTYQHYRQTQSGKPLLLLLLGGITFPTLVLGWIVSMEIFQDFIDFYILGNAVYAGGSGLADIPTQFGKLILLSPDFTALLIVVALITISGIVYAQRNPGQAALPRGLFVPVLIMGYGLAAIYAATKSGNLFVHYLNFCVYPLGLAAALGMQRIAQNKLLLLIGPLLLLAWFGLQDAVSFLKNRQLNSLISVEATSLPESPVVRALKPFATPTDRMVVWGWQCQYYVEAQLAQGTAENHSERSIFQHPLRDVYRRRYLSDMKRTKPAVFLDAVGKNSLWVQNVATQGHESFPELAEYIEKNYQFLGTIDGTRLYVRMDHSPSTAP